MRKKQFILSRLVSKRRRILFSCILVVIMSQKNSRESFFFEREANRPEITLVIYTLHFYFCLLFYKRKNIEGVFLNLCSSGGVFHFKLRHCISKWERERGTLVFADNTDGIKVLRSTYIFSTYSILWKVRKAIYH